VVELAMLAIVVGPVCFEQDEMTLTAVDFKRQFGDIGPIVTRHENPAAPREFSFHT